jgi:hypothetical protein
MRWDDTIKMEVRKADDEDGKLMKQCDVSSGGF